MQSTGQLDAVVPDGLRGLALELSAGNYQTLAGFPIDLVKAIPKEGAILP